MKTNKFFQACIGVAIVLFAAAFLLRSINPAQATPTPDKFITEGTSKIGKYMMLASSPSEVLVWDTETGKNIWYFFGNEKWSPVKFQLPQTHALGN